jgi:hypothetical protein
MLKRRTMTVAATLGLLFCLSLGLSQAQGVGPGGSGSSASAVGTAFRYQGRLTDGGTPADGEYDFIFVLHDSASDGSQVGHMSVNDHTVSDGLFTVELDFGDVFDGKALWLAIMVRPGASAGGYTALEPLQPLTASPYALSLMPGADIEGDVPLFAAVNAKNTNTLAGYGLSGTSDAGEAGAGVIGHASSSSGEVYGVWGKSSSTDGYGVYGEAPQYGVYGEATRTSGEASGVYGLADSDAGTGVRGESTADGGGYGVHGSTEATADGAAGVYGHATSTSGKVDGVYGETDSSTGRGVYGVGPRYGIYGEATSASNFATGVLGKAEPPSDSIAIGVRGTTASPAGYAGYFDNTHADGVDVMAAGSGIIKSEADSVLYLSPHDMVVRGSDGVSVTPMDNGGADIYYSTSGWKYLSIPFSSFGTLFGAPMYIESIEVCYETGVDGYIGTTAVQKNNGGTGATSYINDGTDRRNAAHECYTLTDGSPDVIDNSTWVQFNVWAADVGHTKIYTVKLTLTETP